MWLVHWLRTKYSDDRNAVKHYVKVFRMNVLTAREGSYLGAREQHYIEPVGHLGQAHPLAVSPRLSCLVQTLGRNIFLHFFSFFFVCSLRL